MQVNAQVDHSVNALTTQLTGHAMLQLRLTKGAYSAEHLQRVVATGSVCISYSYVNSTLYLKLLQSEQGA